ncbi:hypothetical protein BCAR13_560081 [Paraburkholderia caribensis]|nr:hypothetical protein BCAR13_560081 [Paraburkholderia caribensis]
MRRGYETSFYSASGVNMHGRNVAEKDGPFPHYR